MNYGDEILPTHLLLKILFLFPRWDELVFWRLGDEILSELSNHCPWNNPFFLDLLIQRSCSNQGLSNESFTAPRHGSWEEFFTPSGNSTYGKTPKKALTYGSPLPPVLYSKGV